MVGLGEFPGGLFESIPLDVSTDGSVIVGRSDRGTGIVRIEAFLWDPVNDMMVLRSVLEIDFGLDLTGWTLLDATGVSTDGLTIVGRGENPLGDTEAWIVTLPAPPAPCLADTTGDRTVNVLDLLIVLSSWETCSV